MSRVYAFVSRFMRNTSQILSAQISATTHQNTYGECAAAIVTRFIPSSARWSPVMSKSREST